MRLATTVIIAAVAFSASPAAAASAKKETLKLHAVVMEAATVFVALLDDMSPAPASALPQLKALKASVSAAQAEWFEQFHAATDKDGYLPLFVCRSAAESLEEISGRMIRFIEGATARADMKAEIGYFRDDLSACETALDLPPTFRD